MLTITRCLGCLQTASIDNALPGRESFSIEIYGMVGVPEADLAEWRARKTRNTRGGGAGGGGGEQMGNKRPRIEKIVYTTEQLKAQLEAHKALMSGKAPPPGSLPPSFSQPPPGFPAPPMGFPASVPPPGYGVPPPGYAGAGVFQRPAPALAGSAPGVASASPYSVPPPGYPAAGGMVPPSGSAPVYGYPAPSFPNVNLHEEAVKTGAKTRMVYTDNSMSPEEKLASTSKYRYVDADDPPPGHQPQSSSMQHQSQSVGSPSVSATQPPQSYSMTPPGFAGMSGRLSPSAAAYPHPPPSGAAPAPHRQEEPTQSYPAVSGQMHMEPPSSNPHANTAEALAATNAETASEDAALRREAEMGMTHKRAHAVLEDDEAQPEPVGQTEVDGAAAASAAGAQQQASGARQGRARAADLF